MFVCLWRVMFFNFLIYLISFVFGEPSPTRILLHESYGFRTSIFFRKLDFSRNCISKTIQFRIDFRIIVACFFRNFHNSFGIDFGIDFVIEL